MHLPPASKDSVLGVTLTFRADAVPANAVHRAVASAVEFKRSTTTPGVWM